MPSAQELKLGEGIATKVLGLEKWIEQKSGAGRPKDQMALPILRATLDELTSLKRATRGEPNQRS